jgi:hypothetical protein
LLLFAGVNSKIQRFLEAFYALSQDSRRDNQAFAYVFAGIDDIASRRE